MASRQTSRPTHAGSALKARNFKANLHARSGSQDDASADKHELNFLSAWWKENKRQYTTIFSIVSVITMYLMTGYMKSMAHQSVQLVISLSLFAISLLNVYHYLTASDHKTITNNPKISSMKVLPSNVHQNMNGSFVVKYWKPSKYTETLFLLYNPLVPILGYVWVRSFEPLAGVCCIFLMIFSTVILHVMVAKMRTMVQNELLIHSEAPKPAHVMTTEIPVAAPSQSPVRLPAPSEYPQEESETIPFYRQMNGRQEMPPSSIFQAPAPSNPASIPLDDLASPGAARRYDKQLHIDDSPYGADIQPLHRSPPKTPFDPYSPPKVAAQTPLANLTPHNPGSMAMHPQFPARTPQQPARTPFGLRIGAGSFHDEPATPSHISEAPPMAEYRPLTRAPVAAQTPSYAQSPFGGAPPPRFSIQDFQ